MQSPTLDANRPPKLVSHTHYCVMGDVTVANSAAIAPGVVLQASPGSRIVVAAGACLAGGVCIQSRQGVLTVSSGANLGANVLIVGHGTIGERACVSPGSTLINPQVDSGALIPPGSLITPHQSAATAQQASNNSQQNNTQQNNHQNGSAFSGNGFAASSGFASGSYISNPAGFAYSSSAPQPFSQAVASAQPSSSDDTYRNTFVEPPPVGPKPIETPSLSDQNGQYVDPSSQSDGVQFRGNHVNNSGNNANSSAITARSNDRVYGKDQVSQLLSTLFPHR